MQSLSLLGKFISILHRQEQKNINTVLKEYGLGFSGYNFLIYISKNEGTSQKKLCQTLVMDEALATRTMKNLEERGFITRLKDKKDARSYAVYLTEDGHKLIPEIKKSLTTWWETLSMNMTESEISYFIELLQTMAYKSIEINQNLYSQETLQKNKSFHA